MAYATATYTVTTPPVTATATADYRVLAGPSGPSEAVATATYTVTGPLLWVVHPVTRQVVPAQMAWNNAGTVDLL